MGIHNQARKHTSSPCSQTPRGGGPTGSKALTLDVDYTPFSSSCFLPSSINSTSLILHLHYDHRLSPALFITSSSFTSASSASSSPPIFWLSLPFVSLYQVQTLMPSFPLLSLFYFISEFHLEQRWPAGPKKKFKVIRYFICWCYMFLTLFLTFFLYFLSITRILERRDTFFRRRFH